MRAEWVIFRICLDKEKNVGNQQYMYYINLLSFLFLLFLISKCLLPSEIFLKYGLLEACPQ